MAQRGEAMHLGNQIQQRLWCFVNAFCSVALRAERNAVVNVKSLRWIFGPTPNMMRVEAFSVAAFLALVSVASFYGLRPSEGPIVEVSPLSALPVVIGTTGDRWMSPQRVRQSYPVLRGLRNSGLGGRNFTPVRVREHLPASVVSVAVGKRPTLHMSENCRRFSGNRCLASASAPALARAFFGGGWNGFAPIMSGDVNRHSIPVMRFSSNGMPAPALAIHGTILA